jgi:hypothetical protein
MFKISLIVAGLCCSLYANNSCNVEKNVMHSIMKTESHPKIKAGYTYLISFNNSKEAQKVKKILPNFFLDNRTIDCKNMETCISLTKTLFKYNIKNLDLGAFQINSYYHKYNIYNYFNFDNSYNIACNYVESKIKKYGYNWYAIASYHSETPKYNYKYQQGLINNYYSMN